MQDSLLMLLLLLMLLRWRRRTTLNFCTHSSIIIEACQVDTLINRNAMHILYFIITSFAYVGNNILSLWFCFLQYATSTLTHIDIHLLLFLPLSLETFMSIKNEISYVLTASTAPAVDDNSTASFRLLSLSFSELKCNSIHSLLP